MEWKGVEFAQRENEDQEIAEGCGRLIKNAIICWNYLYPAQKFSEEENLVRKAELMESIRKAVWRPAGTLIFTANMIFQKRRCTTRLA